MYFPISSLCVDIVWGGAPTFKLSKHWDTISSVLIFWIGFWNTVRKKVLAFTHFYRSEMKIVRNIRGDGHSRRLEKGPDDSTAVIWANTLMFARGKGTFFPDTINLLAFTCIVYERASQRHLPLSFFFIYLRITIRNGGKRWHLKWAREGIWNFRHFEHFAAKYETECKWVLHMSKRKRTLVVLHDEEKAEIATPFKNGPRFIH